MLAVFHLLTPVTVPLCFSTVSVFSCVSPSQRHPGTGFQYGAFLNSLFMGGSFVLLSQQEGWWESTGVRAGWDFIAVLWQRGVASSDPTDCWFNNGAEHRSRGVGIPFIEDNFNQPRLSCLCYCFKGEVSHFFFFHLGVWRVQLAITLSFSFAPFVALVWEIGGKTEA